MSKSMLHIAFITPEYPTNRYKGSIGGIGTFTKNLAQQLISKNCKVTVFIHSQKNDFFFIEDKITIHFVKKKVIKGFTWFYNRKYFNKYVNKVVRKENINVLEAPDWTGFTALMKFNIPLIIRLHGTDTYFCNLEKRKVKKKNKFFERIALLGATKIVGVSKFVSQRTEKLFRLQTSIETIYNTIDINFFLPDHSLLKKNSLLYFGTIIRKKGVLEIAEVFNKSVEYNANLKLTLLGRDVIDVKTGKSTLELFKNILSSKALLNFEHITSVPYNQVQNYIKNAHIVLLPSYAEAFPMTWLEAMALEKKIITSNIGWASELMINGNTGYTVNPVNHDDFVSKIKLLLENEEESNKMAKNARKRIEESFNSNISTKKNLNLYKSLNSINEIE